MFTGIIEEIGRVTSIQSRNLGIAASKVLQGIELGGSIAVNGACLTVTSINATSFSVDIMPETIEKTNLSLLGVGDEVNLEKPLTLGKELGGHLVQGHVDNTGRVTLVTRQSGAMLIRFEAPSETMRYIVKKGFVTVDGVSLTVVDCDASSFLISVVDYTQEHTTLGRKKVGDMVNLEVDIIAKYVERISQANRQGITVDFLQEHGYLVG
ncbi:Riboflavin synthase [subsurface metagenome]